MSHVFKYAISNCACENGWTGQFEVEGYTRFYVHSPNCDERIHYHATEYLMGASWYDFAMIQFAEEDMELAESVCPAKIYDFSETPLRVYPLNTSSRTRVCCQKKSMIHFGLIVTSMLWFMRRQRTCRGAPSSTSSSANSSSEMLKHAFTLSEQRPFLTRYLYLQIMEVDVRQRTGIIAYCQGGDRPNTLAVGSTPRQ